MEPVGRLQGSIILTNEIFSSFCSAPSTMGVPPGSVRGSGPVSCGDDHINDGDEVEGRGGERTDDEGERWCEKAKLEVSQCQATTSLLVT